MKNTILFIIVMIITISCKAQIITDIEDPNYPEAGKYYKDINNILDPFVGVYLYTNNTTSFKIILQKKTNSSASNGVFFEDLLIGGYQYIENGIEKVNTLNDLNNNYLDARKYVITGGVIMTGNTLGQTDALPNEKWINGAISDPISGSLDDLFIRKVAVSGQEAIKIFIYHSIGVRSENDPVPPPISYPIGEEFTLIKQ